MPVPTVVSDWNAWAARAEPPRRKNLRLTLMIPPRIVYMMRMPDLCDFHFRMPRGNEMVDGMTTVWHIMAVLGESQSMLIGNARAILRGFGAVAACYAAVVTCSAQEPATPAGREVVQKVCSACHTPE